MIIKLLLELKKRSLALSISYTLLLLWGSLYNINNVLPEMLTNSDKLFHGVAYFGLTILWSLTFFFKFKYSRVKAIICAALFAFLFGVLIEVLQGSLTAVRQADYNDVIANAIGVMIAVFFLVLLKKGMLKYNNNLHL